MMRMTWQPFASHKFRLQKPMMLMRKERLAKGNELFSSVDHSILHLIFELLNAHSDTEQCNNWFEKLRICLRQVCDFIKLESMKSGIIATYLQILPLQKLCVVHSFAKALLCHCLAIKWENCTFFRHNAICDC